jgi:hypothetical protein
VSATAGLLHRREKATSRFKNKRPNSNEQIHFEQNGIAIFSSEIKFSSASDETAQNKKSIAVWLKIKSGIMVGKVLRICVDSTSSVLVLLRFGT